MKLKAERGCRGTGGLYKASCETVLGRVDRVMKLKAERGCRGTGGLYKLIFSVIGQVVSSTGEWAE
ncbi:hypothetical protein J6590_062021 [Homalodisca vitripennis]|nr:hypothetical protein J6590_062021 [Homalodisca vitripennis]